MASDALFQSLAQALGRPSRAFRVASAGLEIPGQALGGYEQGLQTRQEVAKLKLLNTPLGQIFGSQENIPYGLHPTDTFGTLATVAGSMKDYVNPGVANSVLNAYSDNPTAPPANPTATLPPQQGDSPLPVGPTGKADLSQVLGAAAPSPSMPSNGALPPPITLPPGGMNKATMDVVLPAVKAQSEMRLKRQQMAAEESRFTRGQEAEESRFTRGKMAGVAESAGKNLATTGTIQDDISNLRNLYRGYDPTPFLGGVGAKVASASGSSTFGTKTMQQGNAIQQVAPALGAKINYELTHRFSPGESQLLMNNVAPSATDNEANANRKLDNLQRLVQVFQGGDQNQISMVASAIAGRPVNAKLPTSGTSSPASSTTGDPEADAAIARINAANIDPAQKQARIRAVLARAGR